MALPKANRLTHRRDFDAVYQSGLRRSTPHLILRALKPLHSPISASADVGGGDRLSQDGAKPAVPTRVGISISQKVSKQAVVRNRIKRQIRAAIQHLLPQLSSGWRLVIVVRSGAVQCDYGQFLQELKKLLVDAEVIDGHSGRDIL